MTISIQCSCAEHSLPRTDLLRTFCAWQVYILEADSCQHQAYHQLCDTGAVCRILCHLNAFWRKRKSNTTCRRIYNNNHVNVIIAIMGSALTSHFQHKVVTSLLRCPRYLKQQMQSLTDFYLMFDKICWYQLIQSWIETDNLHVALRQ